MTTLEIRWGTSRGRDSYGYTLCSLWVDGRKVASCNGGGYDMEGTVLGLWLAGRYADRLRALKAEAMPEYRRGEGPGFYGLTFHDPGYDPGKATIENDRTLGGAKPGETVAEAEARGVSFGLERYQAIYSASSRVPTERHTVPSIDGACGRSSVERIMQAIGLGLEYVPTRSRKTSIYVLHDGRNEAA